MIVLLTVMDILCYIPYYEQLSLFLYQQSSKDCGTSRGRRGSARLAGLRAGRCWPALAGAGWGEARCGFWRPGLTGASGLEGGKLLHNCGYCIVDLALHC